MRCLQRISGKLLIGAMKKDKLLDDGKEFVKISWLDPTFAISDTDLETLFSYKDLRQLLSRCVTFGFILRQDQHCILLCSDYTLKGKDDDSRLQLTCIPKSLIVKITKYKEKCSRKF